METEGRGETCGDGKGGQIVQGPWASTSALALLSGWHSLEGLSKGGTGSALYFNRIHLAIVG